LQISAGYCIDSLSTFLLSFLLNWEQVALLMATTNLSSEEGTLRNRLKMCWGDISRSMWPATPAAPVTPSFKSMKDSSSFSARPVVLEFLSPPSKLVSKLSHQNVQPYEPKPRSEMLFVCGVSYLCNELYFYELAITVFKAFYWLSKHYCIF